MNNFNGMSATALFFLAAVVVFIGMFIAMPVFFGIARGLGFYTVVEERQCKVYDLFGKVLAVIDEPGLHVLIFKLGFKAPMVSLMGKCHVLDLRLDQEYLRSTPVNSEEGAPMGLGIWYEMVVSDPVAYLFKNADPRGSLAIRKVHFRDVGMIKQIEEKVVNRLRQVTSAIKQDGANQVNIIASTAEQQAAIEFAKAAAVRPQIVGAALQKISTDPAISRALF